MGSNESKKEQTAAEYQTEVKLRNYANLESELNTTKNALSTMEKEYDECSKQAAMNKANTTREIRTLKSNITNYEKQVKDLNAKVKELSKLTNVEKQLKNTEKKYKELMTQYIQCVDHGCDVEHNERLRLEKAYKELMVERDNCLENKDNSSTDLKEKNAKIVELENLITEKTNKTSDLTSTNKELTKRNLELKNMLDELDVKYEKSQNDLKEANKTVQESLEKYGSVIISTSSNLTKVNGWIEKLFKLSRKDGEDEDIYNELRNGIVEEIDKNFPLMAGTLEQSETDGVSKVITTIKGEKFKRDYILDLITALRKCQVRLTSLISEAGLAMNKTETFMMNSQMNENEREYLALVVLVFVFVLLIYHFRYEIYGLLTGKIRFINLFGSGNDTQSTIEQK